MKFKVIIGERSIEQMQSTLGAKAWPEFMQHDAIVEKHWPSLYTAFLDFQFAVQSDGETVGVGNALALHWEGALKDLPARGLDWAMEKAVDDFKNKLTPNLLVGVQILINPDLRSKGLSYELLELMKQAGKQQGIHQIALPVRPTRKHLHPLVPMEEYIGWVNDKAEPFDPWIRVHVKAGGKVISVCSESMTIEGSVSDWENWTGLRFPESGAYNVPNALTPVTIDLEQNTGTYIEPNVWIVHKM